MKITQVEYSKTFNLGNYQSAKIGFVADVEDGEDHLNTLVSLQDLVEEQGNILLGKPSRKS